MKRPRRSFKKKLWVGACLDWVLNQGQTLVKKNEKK